MAETSVSTVNSDFSAMLTNMTLVKLKKELKKQNLKMAGSRNELILKLLEVMQTKREHGEPQFK